MYPHAIALAAAHLAAPLAFLPALVVAVVVASFAAALVLVAWRRRDASPIEGARPRAR